MFLILEKLRNERLSVVPQAASHAIITEPNAHLTHLTTRRSHAIITRCSCSCSLTVSSNFLGFASSFVAGSSCIDGSSRFIALRRRPDRSLFVAASNFCFGGSSRFSALRRFPDRGDL